NFVLVPLFVYGMLAVIPVPEGVKIGLILLSLAAGAPFLPKLAEIARSDAAFSIGLMLLLMVVTIFYLPVMLPFLLSGAKISSWAIAKSLILLMLIPLLAALFFRARAEAAAKRLQAVFTKLSNIALIVLAATLIILNTKSLIAMVGPSLIAIVLLLIAAMLIGYGLGGPGRDGRVVLSLGTGQRNISAAILVAAQNFKDPEVTLTMVALAVMGLVIMLPVAGRMGKRASR
ncbi:MAG: bile acid:sodium symporter family protein, partial [Deltaproteobacteria bacterium]|nr:bile acid:sodium symporter family protein [Deltaproteobacteria bacterium]